MAHAHFDCASGIAGDMALGALVDAGVPIDAVAAAVRSMGLDEVEISAESVVKRGFRATQIRIAHPPQHVHRHMSDIREMLDRGDRLSDSVRRRAMGIFEVIAAAEAKVHGTTVDKVHFHEVGAIDSIADIVGVAFSLDYLNIESVSASAVPTGCGTITIDHGIVPVPAPATADILSGIPIVPCDIEAEMTTPTGAAVLKAECGQFGSMPAMTIRGTGWGAGNRDFADRANVVRVVIGETSAAATDAAETLGDRDRVVLLETNLDDAPPTQIAAAVERLFDEGALDVWQTPCLMKKGRAGVVLSVLGNVDDAERLAQSMMRHTPAIGVRHQTMPRSILTRSVSRHETSWGTIQIKTVRTPDGEQRRIEDDDVRRIANANGWTWSETRRRLSNEVSD